MTSTATLYPSATLAGSWDRTAPVPVDGTDYTEPRILATATAGYAQADGNANRVASLRLPAIENPPAEIELVGVASTGFAEVAGTTLEVPIAAGVVEGYLMEVLVSTQEASGNDPGTPTAPAGWGTRADVFYAPQYRPHIVKFWKVATAADEAAFNSGAGTLTITWGASVFRVGMSQVWSGVDQEDPYDALSVTSSISATGTNIDPAAIVASSSDGAMVTVAVMGNRTGGTPQANASAGYAVTINESVAEERAWVNCHRIVAGGTVDPGPYSWDVQNATAVTDVLSPSGGAVTVVAVAAVTDETATAQLVGADAEVAAVNEIQTLTTGPGLAAFTLSFGGQTTSTLQPDATAAQVQAAFEALSNFAPEDVSVTGGALDVDPILVEFRGVYANQNVAMITCSDPNLSVAELYVGSLSESFTLQGSVNVPRAGGDPEPQLHVWSHSVTSYKAGKLVHVDAADHDGLSCWTAALFVVEGVWEADPVSGFGSKGQGVGTAATYGGTTPAHEGSKMIAVVAKAAVAGTYSGPADSPSAPAGYTNVADAAGDRMTLSLFASPPVDDVLQSPGASFWATSEERWTTGLFVLRPAVPSTGGFELHGVIDSTTEPNWLEMAGAVGDMYTVFEVDLSVLPADAVLTSAGVRFAHSANVDNPLRVALVGIVDDDTIVAATEPGGGYSPVPTNQTQIVDTISWSEFGDGSLVIDYDRLGIAVISSDTHPALTSHRLFYAALQVTYEEGGPIVSNLSAPSIPTAPITWDYSSDAGLPMTHYRAIVLMGAAVVDYDAAVAAPNGLEAKPGEILYDSGVVASPQTRSILPDTPLARGPMRAAVKVWARLPNGIVVGSEWASESFDLPGTYPPGLALTTDYFTNFASHTLGDEFPDLPSDGDYFEHVDGRWWHFESGAWVQIRSSDLADGSGVALPADDTDYSTFLLTAGNVGLYRFDTASGTWYQVRQGFDDAPVVVSLPVSGSLGDAVSYNGQTFTWDPVSGSWVEVLGDDLPVFSGPAAALLDPDWTIYDDGSPGHGYGARRPSQAEIVPDGTANNGYALRILAENGTGADAGKIVSTGLKLQRPKVYGQYEIRVRIDGDPDEATSGVCILWPDDANFPGGVNPAGGELDFWETYSNRDTRLDPHTNLHRLKLDAVEPYSPRGAPDSDDELLSYEHTGRDASQWRKIVVDWWGVEFRVAIDNDSTPDIVTQDPLWLPDWEMELTLQLDAFDTPSAPGVEPVLSGGNNPAMYVDYVVLRDYGPDPVFDEADGSVSMTVQVPAGVSRAWLQRSKDDGASWEIVPGAPFDVAASTTETLVDRRAPLNKQVRYKVAFDQGPMSESSIPMLIGSYGAVDTTASSWYLVVEDDFTLGAAIEVADADVQTLRRSQSSSQAGASVVAHTSDLGARISLVLRTRDQAQRLKLDEILTSGKTLRLSDVLGRTWLVVQEDSRSQKPQRWAPLKTEAADIRDAHEMRIVFLEVRS